MGSTKDMPAANSPTDDLTFLYTFWHTNGYALSAKGSCHQRRDKRSLRRHHNPLQYDRTLTLMQGRSGRSYP